jgi:hypothetical protein
MKKINLIVVADLIGMIKSDSQSIDRLQLLKLLDSIEKDLPRGNGIDNEIRFDMAKSSRQKIVITFEYHHIKGGCYTGWSSYQVVITPEFHGYDIKITGCRPCKDLLADYFHDLFSDYFEINLNEKLFFNTSKKEWYVSPTKKEDICQ